jgi:hypothetical protein
VPAEGLRHVAFDASEPVFERQADEELVARAAAIGPRSHFAELLRGASSLSAFEFHWMGEAESGVCAASSAGSISIAVSHRPIAGMRAPV